MNTNYMPTDVYVLSSDQIEPYKENLSGIAFTSESVIIGNEGLNAYRRKSYEQKDLDKFLIGGRFSAVIKTSNGYSVFTDPLGQECIFYYLLDDFWMISNSFILLCEELKKRGKRLEVCWPVLAPFLVANQSLLFGGQVISHDMPIKGVKLLPIRKCLRIYVTNTQKIFLEPHVYSFPFDEGTDYKDLLFYFVKETQERLISLLGAGFSGLLVDLSGGYDSRINYGVILKSEIPEDKIKVKSSKLKCEDYKISDALQNRFKR